MTEEPRWKSRLRAWHARPPSVPAEEARRRILQRLDHGARADRRPARPRRGAAERFRLAALAAGLAAAALSLAVLVLPDRPAPAPSLPSEAASGHAAAPVDLQDEQAGKTQTSRTSMVVLELPSGSTLHLTHLPPLDQPATQENSK